MDKKEILNLLFLKSERIRVVKDKKYDEFPDQSSYVEIDGQKTRYYKCSRKNHVKYTQFNQYSSFK